MRTFHVTFLRSYDMNSGEIFSSVVSVEPNECNTPDLGRLGNIADNVLAMWKAQAGYLTQCRMNSNEPEKFTSVIMTEVF